MADLLDAIAVRDFLDKLSPRRREVCLLLAEGRSQVEAARRLGITPQSVQYHVQRIRRRLADIGFDVPGLQRRQSRAARRRRRKAREC